MGFTHVPACSLSALLSQVLVFVIIIFLLSAAGWVLGAACNGLPGVYVTGQTEATRICGNCISFIIKWPTRSGDKKRGGRNEDGWSVESWMESK